MKNNKKKESERWLCMERPDFRLMKVAGTVAFVLFAFYLTAIYNRDYLWKAEDLSLFLPTRMFLADNMQMAGGFLAYCGCFLTQFFYYPWLGSCIFIALLLAVQYILLKAFRIPDRWFLISLLPSFMLLLSAVDLGYVIYVLKSPGYMFSNLLGVLCVSAGFGLYRTISLRWIRCFYIILWTVAGYPLAGFYALFAAFLFAVYDMAAKREGRFRTFLCSVVCIGLVPLLYYILVYTQVMLNFAYTMGLPRFYEREFFLWLPFYILLSCMTVYAFCVPQWQVTKNKQSTKAFILSVAVYLLAFACTWHFTYDDENFRVSVSIDRAIVDNNWAEAVEYAAGLKGEPTRAVVLCTDMALFKQGRAGDEMFRYKIGGAPYKINRPTPVLRNTVAKSLYFQYGKINYCYRWCMEDKVEYGMKAGYLKYMVKCALLNGELSLAQKYNSTLAQTLFHKEWAEKYQRYIDNPSLMAEDAEFMAIRPLMAYDNSLEGDGGLLEGYLISQIAYMEGGPEPLVELSLQCNMVQKDISRFWSRFILYARTHDRLPVHYQEAAVLYSYLERKVDYRQFKIDALVVNRFNSFIEMSQRTAGVPEERLKAIFQPEFGGTFWYYYFFVKGLKTA